MAILLMDILCRRYIKYPQSDTHGISKETIIALICAKAMKYLGKETDGASYCGPWDHRKWFDEQSPSMA